MGLAFSAVGAAKATSGDVPGGATVVALVGMAVVLQAATVASGAGSTHMQPVSVAI